MDLTTKLAQDIANLTAKKLQMTKMAEDHDKLNEMGKALATIEGNQAAFNRFPQMRNLAEYAGAAAGGNLPYQFAGNHQDANYDAFKNYDANHRKNMGKFLTGMRPYPGVLETDNAAPFRGSYGYIGAGRGATPAERAARTAAKMMVGDPVAYSDQYVGAYDNGNRDRGIDLMKAIFELEAQRRYNRDFVKQ